MADNYNSMGRVLASLSHKEPDRVPMFLLFSMYGAKILDVPIKKYFSDPALVAEGQIKLRERYDNDCFYAFYYAAVEVEALGGSVIFIENGPPNAGEPVIRNAEDIKKLSFPKVAETPCLGKVLKTIEILKARAGDEVPIIGVVMSPFSAPIMQMGFEKYLDLMYEDRENFELLMKKNEEFCVEWANAQIAAGATAICYFDPVSSPTIVTRQYYLKTGHEIAKRTIARIKGPVATHLASGRSAPIVEDVVKTGSAVIGVSEIEDISELKEKSRGKITLLGNLNGIKLSHATETEAEEMVKKIIAGAASGGGLIISDNHGEIPWQVPEKILDAISRSVKKWGKYPLKWLDGNA